MKKGIAVLAAAAMSVTALAGCGSSDAQSSTKPDSISFWYYEDDTSAEAAAWKKAAKMFTKDTGIKVKLEMKSFTQIAQNASQFLNSDQAPDIMESNRGNGSAGMLSSTGLLSDLGPYVKKYGWDKKITKADASIAKYNDKGVMNGDKWVGLPTYAEYQRVYYNKDMFAKQGLKIPTAMDEFEAACAKFKAAGITPIAADAQDYGVLWLWWSLVGTKADSKFVDDWQMYKHDVNWNAEPLTYATNKINDWVNKGYISRNATGLKGEDTTVSFIKGEYPIYQTGTWTENRFNNQIKDFDWDGAAIPGAKMLQGCTGNLLTLPQKSKHKDWSAKLLNYAISEELQTGIGNAGSVPLSANMSKITNAKNKKMIEEYTSFSKKGKLSYYPDYPAASLTDAMSSEFQELVNGTKNPNQILQEMKKAYTSGVDDMGVKD
ncbi:ABC transporter substrate-binding protein [Bifidobacterium sp. ESL0764]|uniref:ABC transporter substrate-binding protein n=1 Tax=Bifidobacterium sp. ESL0764 TaxID=2983228 RepID=UPI0023F78CB4|nr:ABC transporter substrate-binding protein [Bifidobacterium sp. ESL0764]WEV65926.1 ABC transporter substrate-binding protein [Bifidobacterium sp. ESL0764]